ncbi:MAG: hypothetical protein U0L86_11110, partial [Alistipes finegoldii]|nr:hypothetical protein [Alistipes finegoldii]
MTTRHRAEQRRGTDRSSNAPQTGTKKQDPKNKTRPAEKTAGRIHFVKSTSVPDLRGIGHNRIGQGL